MFTKMMPNPRAPIHVEHLSALQSPFTGPERVTLNNFWPDALPFLWLVVLSGIIVYLVSGI